MSKMSTDPALVALDGPVMGTGWSALFRAPAGLDTAAVRAALAASVGEVDRQMSTYQAQSDLMRLNRAPAGVWMPVPERLFEVLARGLAIGRASGGAFDIGMGDVVTAWGFGPDAADVQAVKAALGKARPPAHELIELDATALTVRKAGAVAIDLSGIAKGYGADRMMTALDGFGISDALVGLDGEMRARGLRGDGKPWTIAVERPDYETRTALSVLELEDAAVATSGDYRHWVEVGGRRLSHTMDRRRGGPVDGGLASVSVVAETCMDADAWATALMVLGVSAGLEMAREQRLDALFIERDGAGLRLHRTGRIFNAPDQVVVSTVG